MDKTSSDLRIHSLLQLSVPLSRDIVYGSLQQGHVWSLSERWMRLVYAYTRRLRIVAFIRCVSFQVSSALYRLRIVAVGDVATSTSERDGLYRFVRLPLSRRWMVGLLPRARQESFHMGWTVQSLMRN